MRERLYFPSHCISSFLRIFLWRFHCSQKCLYDVSQVISHTGTSLHSTSKQLRFRKQSMRLRSEAVGELWLLKKTTKTSCDVVAQLGGKHTRFLILERWFPRGEFDRAASNFLLTRGVIQVSVLREKFQFFKHFSQVSVWATPPGKASTSRAPAAGRKGEGYHGEAFCFAARGKGTPRTALHWCVATRE